MLESVTGLIEKLTELVKYRAERKNRQFEKIVSPIFIALTAVHQDYLNMFVDALTALRNGDSLQIVGAKLETRRLSEESERRAVFAKSQALYDDVSLKVFHPFLRVVLHYFQRTAFCKAECGSSVAQFLVTAIRSAAFGESRIKLDLEIASLQEQREIEKLHGKRPGDERDRLVHLVEYELSRLRSNWDTIASEYASALANSIP
jgi:hypothetical protein